MEARFQRAFDAVTLPRNELRYGNTSTEGLWFWKRIVGVVFPILDDDRLTELTRNLYERFERAGAWSPYPKVRDVLEVLSEQGVTLALLSNWDARGRRLLENLRLDSFFEAAIFSAEVGYEKPDPRIFDRLLERIEGDHPHRAMIGNHADVDLLVPEERGWTTLLHCPGSSDRWHREVHDWSSVPDRLGIQETSEGSGRGIR